MVSSGVWSVLEGVWLLEEAVRRPLLGLCKRKDLRKRVVPQRDDAGHDVSLATHSKCVKGNVIRSGTLGRISVDTNAHGGARGTGLDMHQCRKEASRAFPGGWETGASTLEWLGNKIAWNWVLNCAAQLALSGRRWVGQVLESQRRHLNKRILYDFKRAVFRETGCRVDYFCFL